MNGTPTSPMPIFGWGRRKYGRGLSLSTREARKKFLSKCVELLVLCFSLYKEKHPWLNTSNINIATWSTGVQNSDSSSPQERPSVILRGITLGTCFWSIINMSVYVIKSNLTGMTLHAEKKIYGRLELELNKDRGLPVVYISNATIMQFSGTYIHLILSDLWITVNTQNILSPIFMMRSSTADIDNCTFHGIQDMRYPGPGENDTKTTLHLDGDHMESYSVLFAAHDSSRISIRNCVFENIQVDSGYKVAAALHAENSHVAMHNSIITRNKAYSAVFLIEASDVLIKDSVFSHNTGKEGASINAQQNSSLEVHNSTFTHNDATLGSGILALMQTSVFVSDSRFSHNTGVYSASINVQQNSSLEVNNSKFTHNNATSGSGILALIQTSVYVTDSLFSNNTGEDGAAINVYHNSNLEVYNSTFTHNNAKAGSGIFATTDSSMFVEDSFFLYNSGVVGTAINIEQNVSVFINNSTFACNVAAYRGAVIAAVLNSRLQIETSMFVANNASHGGAVFFGSKNVIITIFSCKFLQNRAIIGAVVYLLNSHISIVGADFTHHYFNIILVKSSHLDITACNFSINFLHDSNLIQVDGKKTCIIGNSSFTKSKMYGIIEAPRSSIRLYRCRFAHNLITWNGIINALTVLLLDSTVYNNTIRGATGMRYGNATIRRCTFKRNIMKRNYYGIQSLIGHVSGETLATLKVTHSSFIHNEGNIIYALGAVDIVMDGCNFTENKPHHGTLFIQNNEAELRTSSTTITAPAEGNKLTLYFAAKKGVRVTGFRAYNTHFRSGNIMLNSSSTDTFLQEAEKAGLVYIWKVNAPSYKVTQEETVFASGKYYRVIFFHINVI